VLDGLGITQPQIPPDIAIAVASTATVGIDITNLVIAGETVRFTKQSNLIGTLPSCDQQFLGTVTIGSQNPTAGGSGPGMLVSGDSLFYNNVGIAQDLNVAGNLQASNVTADSIATAKLSVSGTLSTNGIVNSGNITTDTLTTRGDATIGGALSVAGDVTIGGSLIASGPSNVIASGNNSLVVNTTGAALSSGANNVVVNANGVQIAGDGAQVVASGANAALVNSTNHGVVVSSTATVVSGGTESTTLQVDDNGARFAQANTGAPVRVTGIANGTSPYDAVNYGQLSDLRREMATGVSATVAVASIPPLEQGSTAGLGVGVGTYLGRASVAVSGNYRLTPHSVFRVSFAGSNQGSAVAGMGVGVSW
jgi:hypothetical protein